MWYCSTETIAGAIGGIHPWDLQHRGLPCPTGCTVGMLWKRRRAGGRRSFGPEVRRRGRDANLPSMHHQERRLDMLARPSWLLRQARMRLAFHGSWLSTALSLLWTHSITKSRAPSPEACACRPKISHLTKLREPQHQRLLQASLIASSRPNLSCPSTHIRPRFRFLRQSPIATPPPASEIFMPLATSPVQ